MLLQYWRNKGEKTQRNMIVIIRSNFTSFLVLHDTKYKGCLAITRLWFFFLSSATGKATLSACSNIISTSTVQKSSYYLIVMAIISLPCEVRLHSTYEKFNIRKKRKKFIRQKMNTNFIPFQNTNALRRCTGPISLRSTCRPQPSHLVLMFWRKHDCQDFFKTLTPNNFFKAYKHWEERCDQCIAAEGRYFEKK